MLCKMLGKEGSEKRFFGNKCFKAKVYFYIVVILLFLIILVSCSIESKRPYVVSVSITDGRRFSDPEEVKEITIVFSDGMNRYVTEKNIGLSGYYGGFIYLWGNNGRTCTLIMKEPLERGSKYTLEIKSGCENIAGYDIGADTVVRFYTYLFEDNFFVVSTAPFDGEVIGECNNLSIEIVFSMPVDYSSVYDSISIEPALNYLYSFSENRKLLTLDIVEQLQCGEKYTIALSEEMNAANGLSLGEEYSFSFSTFNPEESFRLKGSSMKNPSEETSMALDTAYLSKTHGIEKTCDLVVEFSSEFFLSEASKMVTIEQGIEYHLEKNGCALIFDFLEEMTSEEEYRINISGEFENTAGSALGIDYRFGWAVDGQNSVRPEAKNIVMVNPDGGDDVLIFSDNEGIHNRAMLFSYRVDHVEVEFQVEFSEKVNLYRMLDSVSLDFQFGNPDAVTVELTGYAVDLSGKMINLVFSLPDLTLGDDSYYKFIIEGGEDGVIDLNNNSLKEDIEIYVVY